LKNWHEECGVFGIWNHPEAAKLTYLGLYALQHRGQESCGIVSLDHHQHHAHRALGLVHDAFTEPVLDRLTGSVAIGHVRYSTAGGNLLINAQPLMANLREGPVALAHNGNLVNAEPVRRELQATGTIFQGTNDTEVLLHLIARNLASNFVQKLLESLARLEGAYSLLLLTDRKMIAVRDPLGFRPLSIGLLGESIVVASETCAFDLIGAKYLRDVEPGEAVVVDETGMKSFRLNAASYGLSNQSAQCSFEHIYFARPDSLVFGQNVYEVRKNLGRVLARQSPVNADIVVPVPDSGVAAALGYSDESKIPFELGVIRNHYVGRTFIEPKSSIRSFGVKVKLNPMSAVLSGKRAIIIDDSLVRGTTSKKIIELVRQAGAKEVHLRIACPPTMGPCYYGVDTPTREELIASRMTTDEIARFVGADTLSYLSIEGLSEALGRGHGGYCKACFDDKYPTPLYGGPPRE